ncbi:hypothetical protein PHYBLDRAFT_180340 [Phycomyces blakesleeanus NRRL 1555(-)]|uniref:Exocyst complex component Sec8 n=1 Tax=Phycomyces blakesleeanus (strain ATCC 8743b / DSM 1359 / FGSC 10004 / NBRC 33097 / NRRL 1555) TaxID=763407 RepID=A0A162XXL5_PHYB8|nr:hypothetical protein PHYBLDRAFT_180340 [Phycomyces blakesleeanus NRRL 1555(-)]OAD77145.1 hypothetical protein PHYBLDRAFT_180340 [Phycomyces blakesleeanus NRRL 1555(-)]|eukprot:XP_018295185.1 hypothetical protein PHYBLDRAFT_180340 [Phycomyces blakesleeanus NRRL 1555(-)]
MASNPFLQSNGEYSQRGNNGYYADERNNSDRIGDFSEMEVVLRDIHNSWGFMLDENFDPVTLALALMDDSSVGKGKDYGAFQRILGNLDAALKTIVDDYYQGFNNSIGTFGGVLQHINDSQNRVAQMKINLKKCKEELLEKRTDLLNMWHKSQQYKEMINLLETIEETRTTPEKLESLMNSKHVYAAANMLVESWKTVLYDLLIEELHNHLYLKNSYCDNRWAEYVHDQQKLPDIKILPRSFDDLAMRKRSTIDGNIKDEDMFALDENDVLAEDLEINPETDSYYYMEIIMEALAMLGQVPPALETIQERLPLEIYALVEKTIAQVEERHSEQSNTSSVRRDTASEDSDMYFLDKANTEAKNEILKDLLWTLYSKMEAVLRGQRFLETCARRIKKRAIRKGEFNGSEDVFNIYHFHEIWKPVQIEIRSLLQDYLTSRERTPASLQHSALTPDNASGKSGFSSTREKNKLLFKFTESPEDQDLEQAYQRVRTNLYSSFKKQISGFSFSDTDRSESFPHSSVIDKYASDMASKGHKVLVKPDAYNVSVLLKPTMAFLQRLHQVFPNYDDQGSEGFGSFLDDFAINVFLPQIEEKVMQLIHHATVGMDAFQDDRNYKNYSKLPIVKSAVALISVIQSLCRTMHSMPFHTEEYIRMIEVVLLKYYEKCYQRFYSMVVRGSTHGSKEVNVTEMNISTSGDWAQDESLVGLLTQNPFFNEDSKIDAEFIRALGQAEITMELKLKDGRQLEADELIFDSKRLIALGRLYHSLKWFVREIWELRTPRQTTKVSIVDPVSDKDPNEEDLSEEPESSQGANSRRWSQSDAKEPENEDPNPVMLSLRGETAVRFDTLLTTYQQLAETCLFTLRLEARCHTMYYLEMVIREGNYYLEDETYEPDPYVITLNSDLMEVDDCINASLPAKDEMFAFDGLPALIVHLLISEATYIKRMNKNGVQKMARNILALQQNLSNFVPSSQSSTLDRACDYYQLYNLGSEGLIRSIRENGPAFTFDEYLVILGLIHDVNKGADSEAKSATPETPTGSPDQRSSANYSEWLMKLDEVMADYE